MVRPKTFLVNEYPRDEHSINNALIQNLPELIFYGRDWRYLCPRKSIFRANDMRLTYMDINDDTTIRSPRDDEDNGNSAVGARNPLCVRHQSPRMLGQRDGLDEVDVSQDLIGSGAGSRSQSAPPCCTLLTPRMAIVFVGKETKIPAHPCSPSTKKTMVTRRWLQWTPLRASPRALTCWGCRGCGFSVASPNFSVVNAILLVDPKTNAISN